MEKLIKQILEELYMLDEKFKEHEGELITILEKLISAKPETEFSETFKSQLKNQVLEEFSKINSEHKLNFNLNIMNKLYVAYGVVVLLLVITVGAVYYGFLGQKHLTQAPLFETRLAVDNLGPGAFGKLLLNANGIQEEALGLGSANLLAARPQSGGGGGMDATKMSSESAMIMPVFSYEYKYVGEALDLPSDNTLPVYKRVVDNIINSGVASTLSNLNLGVVNLGTFGKKNLQNLSIVEEGDFGHVINIDAQNGKVSFYENYLTWPNPFENCREESCYQNLQLKESDVPDDAELIKIASKFLSDHKIDTSNYSTPEVMSDWQLSIDYTNGRVWVPDAITIIYPEKIDGQIVRDEGGNPYGMSVSINIRYKKVSSLWNLSLQNYQSSDYEIIRDTNKIINIAEQGSWRYPSYQWEGADKITVELGTPEIILAFITIYNNNEMQELYVPALSFPVVNIPVGRDIIESKYLLTRKIVVPLVAELYEQMDSIDPRPMPLLEGSTRPAEPAEDIVIDNEPSLLPEN